MSFIWASQRLSAWLCKQATGISPHMRRPLFVRRMNSCGSLFTTWLCSAFFHTGSWGFSATHLAAIVSLRGATGGEDGAAAAAVWEDTCVVLGGGESSYFTKWVVSPGDLGVGVDVLQVPGEGFALQGLAQGFAGRDVPVVHPHHACRQRQQEIEASVGLKISLLEWKPFHFLCQTHFLIAKYFAHWSESLMFRKKIHLSPYIHPP